MIYCVSDLHGEYDLFLKLLDEIRYSDGDELYVLGDIIDKGGNPVKLLEFIRQEPSFKAICGNHEFMFLRYYHSLMRTFADGDDPEQILFKLKEYFPSGGEKLSWECVDYIEELPYYIEGDDYICVHAGLKTAQNGIILPLSEQIPQVMVYDRAFSSIDDLSPDNKTVLFGHTPCSYTNGTGRFVKTAKRGIINPKRLADYSKIRLDCGTFITGLMGALRLDDMQEFYVNE